MQNDLSAIKNKLFKQRIKFDLSAIRVIVLLLADNYQFNKGVKICL